MTPEEFESKIEAQTETPNLDYKADMAWDVKSFAKDIIAMSNQRDPGYIIIGMRERGTSYMREGVSDANRSTYKIDTMKDQLMTYTDPAVDIQVFFFPDKAGKNYVVIKIAPFKDVPIISRKEIPGELKNNTLYYRNTNKRVESAPISNSTDFRDLIEIAAVRLMQKRKSLGYYLESKTAELLDKELEDIPDGGVLTKIKSKGYWEITYRPNEPEHLESVKRCEEIIRKATVRLGGWELPFIARMPSEDVGGGFTGQNFFEVWTDFGLRKEFLRMYKSGQVKMFRALIEDWYAGDPFRSQLAAEVKSGTVVNILYSLTYLITEVMEFLSRLAAEGLYKNGVVLTMILHNTKNRKLRIDHGHRSPLAYDRMTISPYISISRELNQADIITEYVTVATSIILEVMDAFNFHPDRRAVLNDQQNYITGKV